MRSVSCLPPVGGFVVKEKIAILNKEDLVVDEEISRKNKNVLVRSISSAPNNDENATDEVLKSHSTWNKSNFNQKSVDM